MEQNTKNVDKNIALCHECLLSLLKYFHTLCISNNIKYTLEAGTMLGAAREKGFIPWDDDADVSLVRNEYNKLIDILKNETLPDEIGLYFPEEKNDFFDFTARLYYKAKKIRSDEETTNHYDALYSYATLDIFVMDNIPKNAIKKNVYILLQKFTYGLAMSKRHKITAKKYAIHERIAVFFLSFIGKFISLKSICNLHNKFSILYQNQDTGLLYCTTWSPIFSTYTYDSNYYKTYHLTPFEDTEFYIIDAYDEVLTIGYGDWRKPVKTHDHNNVIQNI